MKRKKSIKPEHLPLVGGCIGGFIGILLLLIPQIQNEALVILNTLILGTITGCAYGWITAKIFSEDISSIKKGVAIGGVIGAVSGVHPMSFGIFVFSYGFSLVYLLLLAAFIFENYWPMRGKSRKRWKAWTIYIASCAAIGEVIGILIAFSSNLKYHEVLIAILGYPVYSALPFLNIVFGFISGSVLGVIIAEELEIGELFIPIFLIPLFAIAGYFWGKKIRGEEKYKIVGEKEKAPISAEERGRRYVMAGVCWFAISFFLFLILDLAATPSYGKGGLLLILSIFFILPGTCALLGMGARAFKRSEERTRVRGAKSILYFGIFWFIFWLFLGWVDSLVIGEEILGLAFLFAITLPGTAVISLISRWSVRGLEDIYGKIYKRSFIAFTSITGVVMVIIFWVPLLNFFYEIAPLLTYPNVMRIVVVAVIVYIVVNVLRILRKK